MKTKVLLLIFLLTYIFSLQSCSDKDKPADADDNFITSAAFTVDGKTYDAVITGNDITITVPYTISLDHATVSFNYTASAKVFPDPTSVTDWDNERQFRVISYNGEENKYTYHVIKDDIRQEGDVTLSKTSDITAFAESGVTVIKGNLTIGTDDGDDISDVKDLSKLKQVEGNLTIKNSYKGTDLTGLDNLNSIGGFYLGSKKVPSTSPLYQISLPALTTVTGDLVICDNNVQWNELNKLSTVGGDIIIHSANLQSIKMNQLSQVSGNFRINSATQNKEGEPEMGGEMVALNLPELTTVGDTLSTDSLAKLQSIQLEKLKTAGGIQFNILPFSLETINLPAIETVEGDLSISSRVVYAAIGSDVSRNEKLTSFGGFDKLKKVGGTLTLKDFISISQLPFFTNLTELGGCHLYHLDQLKNTLDLSNLTFLKQGENECEIKIAYTPFSKIIGKSMMDCKLNIDRLDIKGTFPDIEGIETINDLRIFMDHFLSIDAAPQIKIKKVLNNLEYESAPIMENNAIEKTYFNNLESVGGYFYLTYTTPIAPNLVSVGGQMYLKSKVTDFDLSKLETVGKSESPQYKNSSIPTFYIHCTRNSENKIVIPSIKEVGDNDMQIDVDGRSSKITKVSCPKLENVTGTLYLQGGRASISMLTNKSLTDIDFPALKATGSIKVENFYKLKDFTTFAPLFTNNKIGDGKWSVSGCAYNPTYQNMKDGGYTQP